MKHSEIKVGKTYVNRGAGNTLRKVVAIGPEYLPLTCYSADGKFPDGSVGVLYAQLGPSGQVLWLKSFAQWAKEEVVVGW